MPTCFSVIAANSILREAQTGLWSLMRLLEVVNVPANAPLEIEAGIVLPWEVLCFWSVAIEEVGQTYEFAFWVFDEADQPVREMPDEPLVVVLADRKHRIHLSGFPAIVVAGRYRFYAGCRLSGTEAWERSAAFWEFEVQREQA